MKFTGTNNSYNKTYDVVLNINDKHFKECVILQNSYNPSEQLLLKTIIVSDQNAIEDLIAKLSNLSNEFIVNLLFFNKFSKGNGFQYDLYFDPFLSDLSLEMKARQVERNYFSEDELWKILNSTLKGLCYLHDQEIYHGFLEPNYIKIAKKNIEDNENYAVKLLHPLFIELINEGERFSIEMDEKSYLSPEEFISLKYEETKNYIDYYKADVYCLGLCFLEAATFFSIKSCYDWDTYLMNYEFILRKLLIIHNRYSKHLAYILKNMLVVDDKIRPTFFEIEVLLAKGEEDETEKTKRSLYLSPMRTKYNVEINVFFFFLFNHLILQFFLFKV